MTSALKMILPVAATLILSALLSLVHGWGVNHAGNAGTGPKCEKLSVAFCRGLRYNLTAMPNFMGHEDQRQAERGLTAFMPLVHYNCSRHLRLFLCAVFAPVCSEHVAMQIPACKSLCLSVRRDCEPALTSLTLPWPHMLDCDHFLDSGNTLCVQPPADEALDEARSPATLPAVQRPWSAIREQSLQTSTRVQQHQCPPHFVQIPDVETIFCAPRCGADAYYRAEDKRFTERWMTGWAWLCFLSTLFTLLTFWVEPTRFRYPERPIVFLALCYNLLSVTYIVRGAVGAENISCVNQQVDGGPNYVPIRDALKSIPCTVWWLVRYYLGLASNTWWAVLCGCWLLSAKNEWSSEALHNMASYLHAIAWILPTLFTGGSLLSRNVVADELTGLCQIADESALWLEVIPHAILLLSGCVFGSIAAGALIRVRKAVRCAGRSATKLERLMTRLGIFALLYALPALGGLICILHEASVKPRWRKLALLAALDCRTTQNCAPGPVYRAAAAGLEITLLRLFLSLVIGVTSGMWVWSSKTCRTWSKLLGAPKKPIRTQKTFQIKQDGIIT